MISSKEKYHRGVNFQEEMRRSWLELKNLWRLRIDDSSGPRPADSLILSSFDKKPLNILIEYKRKMELKLRLNDLRDSQLKGLTDFELVNPWHHSLVIVNFLDEEKGIDDTYALRFKDFIYYIKTFKKRSIAKAKLDKAKLDKLIPINCVYLPVYRDLSSCKKMYQVGRILPWLASM